MIFYSIAISTPSNMTSITPKKMRWTRRRDFLLKNLSLKRGSLISNFLPSDTSEDEFDDELFDDDFMTDEEEEELLLGTVSNKN